MYYLVAAPEDGSAPQVYVGQTSDLRARLAEHDNKKDFWERVLVLVSRTHSLTPTHTLFIEWLSIDTARKVGRYSALNANAGSRPHTLAPLEAECREVFETAQTLLATLGHPLFVPLPQPDGRTVRRLMSNDLSLMDLLFPAARQRALAVLLLQPQSAFHLRELARLTDSHAGTLGREVDKLARTGLLLRSEQGNQVRYNANTRHPLFDDLALFRKTHGVVPAVREALAPLDAQIRLALVFGSVARGTPSPGSDVDLLVLGNVDFMTLAQAVFPLHAALGREVNTVLYTPEEFAQRARSGDAFARDVLAKPKLLVKGGADELAELAGDRAAAGPPA